MVKAKRFGTEVGTQLWPDKAKVDLQELIGSDIIVKDFSVLTGAYNEYAVILFTYPGQAEELTTLCGGMVVIKKLQEAKEKGLLPLLGAVQHDQRYYDII